MVIANTVAEPNPEVQKRLVGSLKTTTKTNLEVTHTVTQDLLSKLGRVQKRIDDLVRTPGYSVITHKGLL